MKNHLLRILISILLGLPLSAFGQRVFDIKADLIQLDRSGFQLYKKAANGDYYRIDLGLRQLFDFEHQIYFTSHV